MKRYDELPMGVVFVRVERDKASLEIAVAGEDLARWAMDLEAKFELWGDVWQKDLVGGARTITGGGAPIPSVQIQLLWLGRAEGDEGLEEDSGICPDGHDWEEIGAAVCRRCGDLSVG